MMPKPDHEAETSLIDMPVTRSRFLSYFALLLSAVGLRTAQAHSTRPLEIDIPGTKSSSAVRNISPQTHLQQKTYRRSGKMSDRFPNTLLYTQDNKSVRFYDDLIRNKTVIIDFMWATCDDNCPMKTASLLKLHSLLKRRVGQEMWRLAIAFE